MDRIIPLAKRQKPGNESRAASRTSKAPALLHDPRLIERVEDAMRAGGYAGDTTPPLLAYIAFTSRFLERPMNLAFVAPSAAGKNRAVDAAMQLITPDAAHLVRASSPRALIYSDEDFAHRVIVFGEADSIPREGSAASAIRSLAADNNMVYELVDRDEKTKQLRNRRIEKRGPTGFITTSTRSLGFEMGTRLLEVTLSDGPQQTRAIMQAQAAAAMRAHPEACDVSEFVEAHRWLAEYGVHAVTVPFMDRLVAMIPSHSVRMRRDFPQLITGIKAIALLHQCQRTRTSEGAVEAALDDYAIARRLLASVFDSSNADGLTATIRETVEAIGPNEEVTDGELARRLSVAKSTVSYRVKRAVNCGWLERRETRRGCKGRLARGEPLPDLDTCLPTPDDVNAVFECSNQNAGDTLATDRRSRRLTFRARRDGV